MSRHQLGGRAVESVHYAGRGFSPKEFGRFGFPWSLSSCTTNLFPCQPLAYKARLGGVGIFAVAESVCLASKKDAHRHLMGSPVIPSLSVRDLGSAPSFWCPGPFAYFSGGRLVGFCGIFGLCFLCVARGPRFPSWQPFSSAKRGGRGAARPPFWVNPLLPSPMCRQLPLCLVLRAFLAARAV